MQVAGALHGGHGDTGSKGAGRKQLGRRSAAGDKTTNWKITNQMNELSVGFSQDSDASLSAEATLVHTSLTTPPGLTYFPTTTPTTAALKTALEAYQGAIGTENTAANVALRKAKRDALILVLQKLAANLELTADGDMVKLAATGFDFKGKPVRSTGPLPAPQNLRVKTTGTSGEALAKVAAVALASGYEAQFTLDPLAGSWTSIDSVTDSQNIMFTGLSRGKDYFFRVRALGANGPSGWSDVATMMVV